MNYKKIIDVIYNNDHTHLIQPFDSLSGFSIIF